MSGGMVTNCPNCGAVVHDCVCDYCGTVFPSRVDGLRGKGGLFISLNDDDELYVIGLNVSEVRESRPETRFYADDLAYYESFGPCMIEMTGYVDDMPTMTHKLRRLRDTINERLGDF